jgi:hypothetical protein
MAIAIMVAVTGIRMALTFKFRASVELTHRGRRKTARSAFGRLGGLRNVARDPVGFVGLDGVEKW